MFQELVSNITNVGVFTESFGEWISGISINSAIVFIMMIFMLVGAIDKIAGNKRGYGEKFDEGFNAMGPLAAAMAGVVAAAPVLCIILKPIIAPIYTLVGADPSMFATTLLACDMGGYPLAMQMAANESVGNFAGLILGTMMGPTIVFTIPVALSIIKKSDKPYLGAGVLAGLITVPIGCIVGGHIAIRKSDDRAHCHLILHILFYLFHICRWNTYRSSSIFNRIIADLSDLCPGSSLCQQCMIHVL